MWMQSYFEGRTQAVIISIPLPLTTEWHATGSQIGPNEFPPYTSPVFTIAEKHGIEIHICADDTQLYMLFNPDEYEAVIAKLEECITKINSWLAENHLKLNNDKTEFVIIGQNNLTEKATVPKSIASDCVKNIGGMMDNHKNHVNYCARYSL